MNFQNMVLTLCQTRYSRLQKMLLVSHKITFLENEAVQLCITMRKRARSMTATGSFYLDVIVSKIDFCCANVMCQYLEDEVFHPHPTLLFIWNLMSPSWLVYNIEEKNGVVMFWKSYYILWHIYNYHQCHIKVVIIKRHPDLSTQKDIWRTPHPVTQNCVTLPTLPALPKPFPTQRHNWDEAQCESS